MKRAIYIYGLIFLVFSLPFKVSAFTPFSEEFSLYGYGLFRFCIAGKENPRGLPFGKDCLNNGSFSQLLLAPFFQFKKGNFRVLFESEIMWAPEFEIFGKIEKEENVEVAGFGEIDFPYVFAEYEFHKLFTIRAGKFLLPMGLYQELRDAAPSYLFLFLPKVYEKWIFGTKYAERFFPKYDVGLQARGETDYLIYALFIGNGRGVPANVADANSDKSFGGKLFGRIPHGDFRNSKIGFSFYTDKNSAKGDTRQTTLLGSLEIRRAFNFGGIILLSEFGYTLIGKNEKSGIEENISGITGYGLLSYQIPIKDWSIYPYIAYDFIDPGTKTEKDELQDIFGGVAINPSEELRIKAEFHYQKFDKSTWVLGLGLSYTF